MATNPNVRPTGDGIELLTRLPGLAGPFLQIDLERELQHLRQEDSWLRETGRSSKTLAKYPDFRIVLILMKAGTFMRQHRAKGRISIQQLRGKVHIHLADRKVTVPAGDLLVLDRGVLHDVEALEESAFLLTISWRRDANDASEPLSFTQQPSADEETLSRMGDDGGLNEPLLNPPGATGEAASGSYRYFKDHPVRTLLHELFIEPKEVTMAAEAALTAGQTSRLVRREKIAESTLAFHFEKPSGFAFKPGQYLDITLRSPAETDPEGNTRTFSIASPPFEDELVFITRMRNTAFKRSLETMPEGTEVRIDPAMGSFVLHGNLARPAVFLAGGIGITPFLSIARQAGIDHLPQELHLFYSNRRPEDAAFLGNLQTLEKANPNFRLTCTMTEMSKSRKKWKGETTPIDKEMLSRHLASLQGPIYYIAGPPAMVAAMSQMLLSAGIEKDDIRLEEFAGY